MKKKNRYDILYWIVDTLRLFMIVSIVVVLFFTFVVRNKTIVGSSMYPTLIEQEKVFINVAASYISGIERFDIVVAKSKLDDELWVKRVIGLPNEKVSYKKGILYINGIETKEDFLDKDYEKKIIKDEGLLYFTQDMEAITLGKDEYLLAGDNRNNSLDSRNASIGPFPREAILSKGLLVYSPLSEARYIQNGK